MSFKFHPYAGIIPSSIDGNVISLYNLEKDKIGEIQLPIKVKLKGDVCSEQITHKGGTLLQDLGDSWFRYYDKTVDIIDKKSMIATTFREKDLCLPRINEYTDTYVVTNSKLMLYPVYFNGYIILNNMTGISYVSDKQVTKNEFDLLVRLPFNEILFNSVKGGSIIRQYLNDSTITYTCPEESAVAYV